MIDDTSPPGSWKRALEHREMTQRSNDTNDTDALEVVMEKCTQWKQSMDMLCRIHSDKITLGDLYRCGITVNLVIDE